MRHLSKLTLPLLGLTLLSSGCFRGPLGLLTAVAGTAIITAAVVSAASPPPPRVIVVPPPRPGFTWQPGYWVHDERSWVWVDGRWIPEYPGYRWAPAHWEQSPGGAWHLVPGQWIPAVP